MAPDTKTVKPREAESMPSMPPMHSTPSVSPMPSTSPVHPMHPMQPASEGRVVGSKSVPGSKPAEAPLAGGVGDTVTFKRINLVYVEDGDSTGTAR